MKSKPTYEELERRVRALEKEVEALSPLSDTFATRKEKNILMLLADEWEEAGPPGIMDIRDVADRLRISPEDIKEGLEPLYADGFVDMDNRGFTIFLTPEGYDRARG